jgi:hypothetical protein
MFFLLYDKGSSYVHQPGLVHGRAGGDELWPMAKGSALGWVMKGGGTGWMEYNHEYTSAYIRRWN